MTFKISYPATSFISLWDASRFLLFFTIKSSICRNLMCHWVGFFPCQQCASFVNGELFLHWPPFKCETPYLQLELEDSGKIISHDISEHSGFWQLLGNQSLIISFGITLLFIEGTIKRPFHGGRTWDGAYLPRWFLKYGSPKSFWPFELFKNQP